MRALHTWWTLVLVLWPGLLAAEVTAYPPYPGAKASALFSVAADGVPVFTHDFPTFREQGRGDMHYAHCAFTGEVTVTIRHLAGPVTSCTVRPLAYGITPVISGDRISFTLTRPRHLLVFINQPASYDSGGLMLFAEAPEVAAPRPGDPGVIDLGARGIDATGTTVETARINRAIEEAASHPGGGVVYFPAGGVYRTGTVFMRSGVTVYVEAGALIRGSVAEEDYPIHRNGSRWGDGALFAFQDVHGARLMGRGTIDASGYPELYQNAPKRHLYGYKLGRCRDVLFQDLILRRASKWTVHLFDCEDVTSRNLKILNRKVQYNEDVYDIDVSRRIRIENGFALTMDDFFALKGTPGAELVADREIRDITIDGFVGYGYDTGLGLGYSATEVRYTGVRGVHVKDYHAVACHVDYAVWISYTRDPPTGYSDDLDRPLHDLSFTDCSFESGGGIYLSAGAAPVTGLVFERCTIHAQARPNILRGRNVSEVVFRDLRIGDRLITSAADFTATGGMLEVPAVFLTSGQATSAP